MSATLSPGQRFHMDAEALSEASIIEFAESYDFQPMHIDPARAPVIASGWQTVGIALRLLREHAFAADGPGAVIDRLAWREPVRPGDALRLEVEIVGANDGRLAWRASGRTQAGNEVLLLEGSFPLTPR